MAGRKSFKRVHDVLLLVVVQQVSLNNMVVYCLAEPGLPLGASLGLQASGLPSGAQHVPFTVP